MKLIEKLAQECSEVLWGNAERDDPPGDIALMAYEAGFRKAQKRSLSRDRGEVMDYCPETAERLLAVLDLLGRDEALKARAEAVMLLSKTSVSQSGSLLGGKLTITLEFDETSQVSG